MSPRDVAIRCAEMVLDMYAGADGARHMIEVNRIQLALKAYARTLPDSPSEAKHELAPSDSLELVDGNKLHALERDAARYRWLRGQFCPPLTTTHPVVIGGWGLTQTANGGFTSTYRKLYEDAEQIDAAIDAAMSAQSDTEESK